MLRRSGIATHFRSNVIGYLALFVALGGAGAWAAEKIGSGDIAKNAVKSKHIKKENVKASDLGANAVDSGKIAPGSVATDDIADGGVNSAKVANDSLTGADIDESTLAGLIASGATMPSGATVTGVFAVSDYAGFPNGQTAVSFPLTAPAPLTNDDVNVSPSSSAEDDDPTCTGSVDQPTAPPGKVCLYVDLAANANTLGGYSLGDGRRGFRVILQDDADLSNGTWAYTAP